MSMCSFSQKITACEEMIMLMGLFLQKLLESSVSVVISNYTLKFVMHDIRMICPCFDHWIVSPSHKEQINETC